MDFLRRCSREGGSEPGKERGGHQEIGGEAVCVRLRDAVAPGPLAGEPRGEASGNESVAMGGKKEVPEFVGDGVATPGTTTGMAAGVADQCEFILFVEEESVEGLRKRRVAHRDAFLGGDFLRIDGCGGEPAEREVFGESGDVLGTLTATAGVDGPHDG